MISAFGSEWYKDDWSWAMAPSFRLKVDWCVDPWRWIRPLLKTVESGSDGINTEPNGLTNSFEELKMQDKYETTLLFGTTGLLSKVDSAKWLSSGVSESGCECAGSKGETLWNVGGWVISGSVLLAPKTPLNAASSVDRFNEGMRSLKEKCNGR